MFYGTVLFLGGARAYDLGEFFGLRQLRGGVSEDRPTPAIKTRGMLGHVRHPWYAAGIIFAWTVGPITDVSLVARVIVSLYLVIGAHLEERKLISMLGTPYERYRQRVPMLFPWPWLAGEALFTDDWGDNDGDGR